MKLPEKQQLIIVSVFILLVIGFAVFGYVPLSRKISDVREDRAVKHSLQQELNAKLDRIPELQEEIERLRGKVGYYDEKIPADRDFGSFLQHVTKVMDRHGLDKQLVQPGSEVSLGKELRCIPVTMQCTGSLEKVFEFLCSIEQSMRIIRIESLELSNIDFGGEVRMIAGAKVFYRNI